MSAFGDSRQPVGSLRNGGPRHDNDHEDIAKINIAPTEYEILSALAPYIPQNKHDLSHGD